MKQWECFEDEGYYSMYAIRPVGDRDFHSKELIHVGPVEEAKRLVSILNQYEQKLDKIRDGLHACTDVVSKLQKEWDV